MGIDRAGGAAPGNAWGTFLTMWAGQFVSTLGSSLTAFAAAWWVFEQTGSATQFALTVLFEVLPFVVLSPFAGVFIDRHSRRQVMILSDVVAASSSAVLLALLLFAQLEVWHVYLATLLNSVAGVFQGPAYSASVSLLVPKALLGRANGLVQLGRASGRLVAPVAAGFLVSALGLEGVIAVDLATFAVALSTLLVVRFPQLERQVAEAKAVWRDLLTGWRYLARRRGLLGLSLFYMLYNFLNNFGLVLTPPLLLSLGSPEVLGVVLSVGGSGMVLGGIFTATWGPSRGLVRINLGFLLLSGVGIVLVGLRPYPPLIAVGLFIFYFSFAVAGAAGSALFQRKVAPEVQGRVFATDQTLSYLGEPFVYLLVGPLAEFVFGPLLVPGGGLAETVGRVVGIGSGRGMGLLTVLAGLLIIVTTLATYLIPSVRRLEKELPDEV